MSGIVLHALEGTSPPIVARLSGHAGVLREAERGLPAGAATPEAVAARIRRGGVALSWGDPEPALTPTGFLRFCRARGASSVELVRADPRLLPDLELGSFFDLPFKRRTARRVLLRLGGRTTLSSPLAASVAFWRGVRSAATPAEWRRFTRSSYVVLYYHRIAARKPGQDRLNVAPDVFERHMRWIRRLKLRPLTVDEVIRFHTEPDASLPRRAVVLCADDAFRDAVIALGRHGDLRPIVFVTTAEVGGKASWEWADGEPIASWSELEEFAAVGGTIASHARTHIPLPELDRESLRTELNESLQELRTHLPTTAAALAYPHGEYDGGVRAAAAAVGYSAAFTTHAGRNGAGTDRYQLRRVGPKDWDGAAAFLWKALTGEGVPWAIERWRLRVRGLR